MATMRVPHPIPYQGSKRKLAPMILNYIPHGFERLVEPFAGSAAVSIAAASARRARRFLLNDINGPLMALWDRILSNPNELMREYAELWSRQLGDERRFYDQVRADFNTQPDPARFLYLLARCVKASVRYNAYGEFNQSPDNRRKGARPETMAWHVFGASELLRERTATLSKDYRDIFELVRPTDIVYMDPPYQGVCITRDSRYIEPVHFSEFVDGLEGLNTRGIAYLVSYDGRLGDKSYGQALPGHLALRCIEIHVGRSSQATLLGRDDDTCETLYLSPSLCARLDIPVPERVSLRVEQAGLFAEVG